mmetsp:Transcript_9284/g.37979  ORF Transcript_9284/g.37979 Transcript_9284/m.37979 type:complete len:397 (-) Transcript_9284:105-1295(-)
MLDEQGARSVDAFEKLEQVGEGTYGQVYMARSRDDGEIVALKKVRMDNEKEGFPITAIREIKILNSLNHTNVIKLKEIVTSRNMGSIYMVFEYMDHDLTGLADRPGMKFSVPQVKCYMKQLLTGLTYCHLNNILHRDIKGSNLLINNQGVLKLADFGLARPCALENSKTLTNRVITLWYRPPELLLGTRAYGPAVDMWSAGCIFAELLQGRPIFPGKDEAEQLDLICKLCGTPTILNWAELDDLPWAKSLISKKMFPRRIQEEFRRFPSSARDLIDGFLTLDPKYRTSAKDALDSDYFWEDPMPCLPRELPKYEPSHEYQTRKRHRDSTKQEVKLPTDQKFLAQVARNGAGDDSSLATSGPSSYQSSSKYSSYRSHTRRGAFVQPSSGQANWTQTG